MTITQLFFQINDTLVEVGDNPDQLLDLLLGPAELLLNALHAINSFLKGGVSDQREWCIKVADREIPALRSRRNLRSRLDGFLLLLYFPVFKFESGREILSPAGLASMAFMMRVLHDPIFLYGVLVRSGSLAA